MKLHKPFVNLQHHQDIYTSKLPHLTFNNTTPIPIPIDCPLYLKKKLFLFSNPLLVHAIAPYSIYGAPKL